MYLYMFFCYKQISKCYYIITKVKMQEFFEKNQKKTEKINPT